MITSKFILEKLGEEYFNAKNVSGNLVTVYMNPSVDEFKELEKLSRKSGGTNVLRFVADGKNQKMYVWDAYNARHVDIRSSLLHLPANFDATPHTIDGYLEVSGGKAKMFAWEDIQEYIIMKNKHNKKLDDYFSKVFFTYKWTWLDKYDRYV